MYSLFVENNNQTIKIANLKNKDEAIQILNYFRKVGLGGYFEKIYEK